MDLGAVPLYTLQGGPPIAGKTAHRTPRRPRRTRPHHDERDSTERHDSSARPHACRAPGRGVRRARLHRREGARGVFRRTPPPPAPPPTPPHPARGPPPPLPPRTP